MSTDGVTDTYYTDRLVSNTSLQGISVGLLVPVVSEEVGLDGVPVTTRNDLKVAIGKFHFVVGSLVRSTNLKVFLQTFRDPHSHFTIN